MSEEKEEKKEEKENKEEKKEEIIKKHTQLEEESGPVAEHPDGKDEDVPDKDE